jgi:tetratricopeptide (TPR) repeat protein
VDEHCRIECGASNFKLAAKLKATGNAMFKQRKFDEAKAAYEQALERAATVAYSKQFGGWRECGSCEACASGSFRDCAQPALSTDAKDAVNLWTTLLSNRAECWLRAGDPETPDTPINPGAMAAAVLVDPPYGALGADPGHAKSRSRRERAIAAIEAEHEAASNTLASNLGSLLLATEDLSTVSTVAAGDAVLRVGDTLLRVHRCILVARTEYFRNAFEGEFSEASPDTDGVVEVKLDDVEPQVMRELLWCIYTGEPPEPTVEILAAAHRFGCEVVQIQCEALFVDAIDVEQVCDVLLLAEHYGRQQLRAMAIAYIAGHQEDVEGTEGWSRLSPVLLEEIASASKSGEAVRDTAITSRA